MRTFSFSLASGLASLAAMTLCGAAFAADMPAATASAPGAHRHGPSPQAMAACMGKTEGSAVTWTGRKGQQRTGTCQSVNGVMSARPSGAKAPTK